MASALEKLSYVSLASAPFHWCIFLYNFKFSVRINFQGSNFRISMYFKPHSWDTRWANSNLLTLGVRFFHRQGNDMCKAPSRQWYRLPFLQGHLEHRNRRKVAVPESLGVVTSPSQEIDCEDIGFVLPKFHLQWNLFITATYGPNISGCCIEVDALQRCKCIDHITWDLSKWL